MTQGKGTGSPVEFEVTAFFAADYAVVESGKAYVSGGFFDMWHFASYPAPVSFSLIAIVKVPAPEYLQDHKFAIGLQTADGEALEFRIEGDFRVGANPNMRPGDPTTMPMAIPVHGWTLERIGDYAFTFEIDGREYARYPIRAVQMGPLPQFS